MGAPISHAAGPLRNSPPSVRCARRRRPRGHTTSGGAPGMTKLCEGRVAHHHGRRPGHRPRARAAAGPPRRQDRGQRPRRVDGRRGQRPGPGPGRRRRDQGHGRRGHRQQRRHQRLGRRRAARAVRRRHLRRPRRPHQQRRHPARPHAHQHERGGVGRGDQGAPEGHLRPVPPRRRLLARAVEGGRDQRRPHHQHLVAVGHLRQRRADQLRRRQGRHRQLHDHRGQGARPLRRHRERHRPGRAHPHDRGPRHGPGPRGDQGADVAGAHRADRRAGWPAPRRPTSPVGSSTSPAGCCR